MLREDSQGDSQTPDLGDVLRAFEQLSELEEDERLEALRGIEAESPALHREVELLFRAESDSRAALPRIAPPVGGAAASGTQLGSYRVLREIGRGGMGAVFEAQRSDGTFEARVAVKVIGNAFANEELLERFKLETSILGKLDHPGVARILDAGTGSDGLPFLAMEYVDGLPIDGYCDAQKLTTRRRVELFLQVCEAVSFAHRNLIVHRDLKPSNVLVDEFGQCKLLDFGIAKLLGEDAADSLTLAQVRGPMTPAYASPEQLDDGPISTTSDLYSLGVLLFELLVGEPPFDPEEPWRQSRARSLPTRSLESFLEERDANTLQQRLKARGLSSVRALTAALRGDLESILSKATHFEADRRYGSVGDLSADLRRYLEGLPVLAQPLSLTYRATKFLRRHAGATVAVGLVVASLGTGLGVSLVQTRNAQRQQALAERASSKTGRINEFLLSVFERADPSWYVNARAKGPDTRIIDVLEEASTQLETGLLDLPIERADLLNTLGNAYRALGMMGSAQSHLERALELRVEHQGEVHPDTVETLYFLSASCDEHEEGIDYLRRALAAELQLAEPSSNAPYLMADLSDDLIYAGRLEEAERLLQSARRIDARPVAQIENNLALLALHRGDLDGANALTETHPEDQRALVTRMSVHFFRGEHRRVLEDPTPVTSRSVLQSRDVQRARSLLGLGRIEEAQALLDRLQALGPTSFSRGRDLLLANGHLAAALGDSTSCEKNHAAAHSNALEGLDSTSRLLELQLEWLRAECMAAADDASAVEALRAVERGFDGHFGETTHPARSAAARAVQLQERRAASHPNEHLRP
ncbi:MAG: serine/threonine-protein kinase [Acidobacteriota bacterium]